MDREHLKERLQSLSKDGKISCKQALKAADEEGVPPKLVGELLDELKIKIASCQLGCFP